MMSFMWNEENGCYTGKNKLYESRGAVCTRKFKRADGEIGGGDEKLREWWKAKERECELHMQEDDRFLWPGEEKTA